MLFLPIYYLSYAEYSVVSSGGEKLFVLLRSITRCGVSPGESLRKVQRLL